MSRTQPHPSPALLNNMAQKGLCNCSPFILEQLSLAHFTLTKQKQLFFSVFCLEGLSNSLKDKAGKIPEHLGVHSTQEEHS